MADAPATDPIFDPASPSTPSADPSGGNEEISLVLSNADSLVRLCEALREPGGTSEGSAVARERASERRAVRREEALASRFVALVDAPGFVFRPYDLESRRLVLDPARTLALGDGAELIPIAQDPQPGFAVGPEFADRLLQLQSEGRLALRVQFRIAGSQLRKDACAWISGGRIVRMEIDILSTALLGGDSTVLARGDTGEHADGSLATTVKSPRVLAQKARITDGGDLPAGAQEAFARLAEKSLPCYEQALRDTPGLRGTLVLGLRAGTGGAFESPHVEMSSLGHPGLAKCVAGKASLIKSSTVPVGARISVPLIFSGKDD